MKGWGVRGVKRWTVVGNPWGELGLEGRGGWSVRGRWIEEGFD